MIDKELLLSKIDIIEYFTNEGCVIKKKGKEFICLCPLHSEKTPSFCINPEKKTYFCHGGCGGGDVFTYERLKYHLTFKEALRKLGDRYGVYDDEVLEEVLDDALQIEKPVESLSDPLTSDIEWVYTDKDGNPLYKKVRHGGDKKGTRQYKYVQGTWQHGMDGVERVLYNLPEVVASDEVCLCEGEKDAETLKYLGYVATTAGGCNDWIQPFSEVLKGKKVVLFFDNDTPGEKLRDTIVQDLKGVVEWLRIVEHPRKYKDITDYLDTFTDVNIKVDKLQQLVNLSEKNYKGFTARLYSPAESEDRYLDYIKMVKKTNAIFDMGDVFPALKGMIAPKMPGEVICLISSTGQGKSAMIQNIIHKVSMPTLFCQLELSTERLFQRDIQINTNKTGGQVWRDYDSNQKHDLSFLSHVVYSHCPGMTVQQLYMDYETMQEKFGWQPKVIYVDYIQLMRGGGKGRYESTSDIIEDLKTFAVKKGVIVFVVSQVSREVTNRFFSDKQKEQMDIEDGEIFLTDAKGSGSIEQSCQLILGMWRTDKESARLKVIKDTDSGHANEKISLEFDGKYLQFKQDGYYGEQL